jgi:hypothetical protein
MSLVDIDRMVSGWVKFTQYAASKTGASITPKIWQDIWCVIVQQPIVQTITSTKLHEVLSVWNKSLQKTIMNQKAHARAKARKSVRQ